MKLRMKPEDFIVEEILDFNKIKGDKCYLYKLTKRNIESFKAFSYIAKKFKIPLKDIGYCGLKDRHAVTTQYISIPKEYGILRLDEPNLKLKLVGESKFLLLGDQEGNKFTITVRDLKEKDIGIVKENLKYLHFGAPNYFDSQRFGSVFDGKFIAKEIIKGNYEEAAKIILTKYKKSEKKIIKDLKRFIGRHWGDWDKIIKYIEEKNIKAKLYVNMINELNKSNDFKKALNYVDERLKKIFFAAYQSFLWNECIKEYLSKYIPKEDRVYYNYECGTILFYKKLDDEIFEILKNKTFPTIAPDVHYEGEEKKIIDKILKREGLKLDELYSDFGKFIYHEREVLNIPKNLKVSEFEKDELNKGKYKITLSYELNKGSYATIIIKRAFLGIKTRKRRR
ncbi:tRNA pseudouridine synthase D [Methanocaldococcus villosus KIN24-T80]|uniref:tRNA pseudouridine synthase D n=1 Tax=Methanocaldococcus villosus KIN24-T80 TaxID=1069083 RepID=N6V1X6_9EURY|nr:tRNA pseudouridine(13) synthase TruD [Methanocaldococcus villosus]ENN96293.1 tRNA pseudouridine synthase D [Methanocaldococcus villosus KIN24-T80]